MSGVISIMEYKKGALDHIEIYVSDLKKSTKFWGWFLEKLGYELYQKWGNGISWKLHETYIVFVQTEPKHLHIPYHRRRVGLNHLAFRLTSTRQVGEWKEELRKKKIKILYKERNIRPNTFYFEDPDRIKIELTAPSEK